MRNTAQSQVSEIILISLWVYFSQIVALNFCYIYFASNFDHLSLLSYSTENVAIMVTETLIPEVVTVTQVITTTGQVVTMETTNKMAIISPSVDAKAMMLIAIALSGTLLVAVILLAFSATSLLCLCLRRRKKLEVHESKDPQG